MSLIMMDSFRGYDTFGAMGTRWRGGAGATGGGPGQSPGCYDPLGFPLYNSGSATYVMPGGTTVQDLIVGFNWLPQSMDPGTGSGVFFRTYGVASGDYVTESQVGFYHMASLFAQGPQVAGALAPQVNSSPAVWIGATWGHVQFRTTVNSGTGAVRLRVKYNDVQVVDVTQSPPLGATWPTAITAFGFVIGGFGSSFAVDNFYSIQCEDGLTPSDWVGDCRVTAIFPSAAGASTQFTPSDLTRANWEMVDDSIVSPSVACPDGDATYVSSKTPGDEDLYRYPALVLPAGSTIIGLQHNAMMRKDDAGDRTACLDTYIAPTHHTDTAVVLGTSYVYTSQVWGLNPQTGVAWVPADVGGSGGAQFGVQVVS